MYWILRRNSFSRVCYLPTLLGAVCDGMAKFSGVPRTPVKSALSVSTAKAKSAWSRSESTKDTSVSTVCRNDAPLSVALRMLAEVRTAPLKSALVPFECERLDLVSLLSRSLARDRSECMSCTASIFTPDKSASRSTALCRLESMNRKPARRVLVNLLPSRLTSSNPAFSRLVLTKLAFGKSLSVMVAPSSFAPSKMTPLAPRIIVILVSRRSADVRFAYSA
mmetsp:Transcript_38621/g.82287  ORF Transcript_38621/g.82287 Transcript_38621/m.82287 type:complete len:222 (+) Transcript_38621:119-784(+)